MRLLFEKVLIQGFRWFLTFQSRNLSSSILIAASKLWHYNVKSCYTVTVIGYGKNIMKFTITKAKLLTTDLICYVTLGRFCF